MRKSRLPLAVALLTAALGACKKPNVLPAECAQVRRPPAAFLAHWNFPTGSYWVYRRRGSSPAEVDTVTVVVNKVRVFQPGANTYGLPTCGEIHDYTLEHSNRRHFRGISSTNGFRGLEFLSTYEGNGEWLVTQESRAANLSPLGAVWAHPQRPVGQPIAPRGPVLLDTLPVRVPAGTFPRSVHLRIPFFFDSTGVDAQYLYDYHLTRGVGYTRLRYANLGTWELVKYVLAPR